MSDAPSHRDRSERIDRGIPAALSHFRVTGDKEFVSLVNRDRVRCDGRVNLLADVD